MSEPSCDHNGTMPGRCVEAFTGIARTLGNIEVKLDSIKEITAHTNGDVAQLGAKHSHLQTRIGRLESKTEELRASRALAGGRAWIILVVILTAVLTTLGRYLVEI